jgi:hypothetical protein
VFVLVVLLTVLLPIWSKLFKRHTKSSKAEYVFAAGSSLPLISIMISVARGTLGVKSFLGCFIYDIQNKVHTKIKVGSYYCL